MTEQIVRELVNGEWVTRAVNATGGGGLPDSGWSPAGDVLTVQNDGTVAAEASSGPSPGTLVPVANTSGVTVDTTTYDDNIAGSGKLTTLIATADQTSIALAIAGDDFPRIILTFDPTDYGVLVFGDGTFDATQSGASLVWDGAGASGNLRLVTSGTGGIMLNNVLFANPLPTSNPGPNAIWLNSGVLTMGS